MAIADPKDSSDTDIDNEEGMYNNCGRIKDSREHSSGTTQTSIQNDDETSDKSNRINKEVVVSNSIAHETIQPDIPMEESDKLSQILAMLL